MLSLTPLPRINHDSRFPLAGPFMVQMTAPASYPVSLTEAKAHLRIDGSDEDAVVTGMIAAASDHVEAQTGRALLTQQWELHLERFPAGYIDIPMPPCRSIGEIAVRQADWVVVDPAGYRAELPAGPRALPGRVFPVAAWPSSAVTQDAVRIKFSAGYDTAPPALKSAILLALSDLYCNRGAQAEKQLFENATVEALIGPYRVYAF